MAKAPAKKKMSMKEWEKSPMDKKMDKMEKQMEQLLDMASRSKGAIWLGIGLWSILTGVVGFFFGKH